MYLFPVISKIALDRRQDMTILIVDGQGGGMGRTLIEKLREAQVQAEIFCVGTNGLATSAMLKAGADGGATGENAVIYNARRVHLIVGGAGILCANAMMGEISPAMAAAISQSEAVKLLIPMSQCNLRFAGMQDQPLPVKLDNAVRDIVAFVEEGRRTDG